MPRAVAAATLTLALAAVSPLAAAATPAPGVTTPGAPAPATTSAAGPTPTQAPTPALGGSAACPDFEFIGARGSGEDNQYGNSTRYTAKNPTFGMGGELHDVYRRLDRSARAGGVTITPYGVPYPAVGIDVIGGSSLTTGDLSIYTKSVELGAHAAAAEIERVARACPDTGVIVSGYSQGAQAMVDAVRSATPRARARIVAAVFFGNTYFDSSDSSNDYGSYEPGLDGYLVHSGALPANAIGPNGPVGPGWAAAFGTTAIFDYCHTGDPICGLVDERTVDGTSYPVRDFAHIVSVNSSGATDTSILTQHTDYSGADTANAAAQLESLLDLPFGTTSTTTPAVITVPESTTVGTATALGAGGSLSDPADPIISYRWTVGAGTASAHAWSTRTPRTTVTFATVGPQRVTLRTTTADGTASTNTATITVLAAPTSAPAAPAKVDTVAGDGAAALSWPQVPGAEFYAVRDTKGKLLTAFTPLVPGQGPVSWTDTGLKNGATRSYKVYAVNSMGASAPSAVIKVTPHRAIERPVAPPVSLPRPNTASVDPELVWSLGLGLIVVVGGVALVKEQQASRRRSPRRRLR